jgi:L-iditol 2-dehydrogenase
MKALVKTAPGNGNLEVVEVPDPECGPDQVLVEVAYCGVCGTDIHVMHDTFRNYPPVILGHEISGKVAECGRNVQGFRRGEVVTVLGATAVTCGKCEYCRSGYFIFCRNRRGMGHGVNGGFTRYIAVRPDQLYRVPEVFTLEEAALSEPFAAIVQAISELTPVQMGDVAVVSGPGPMGLLAVKLLIAQGIKTIVAGAPGDSGRLAAARSYGADAVVNVGEQDLAEVVRDLTHGRGADVAFECAGHHSSVRGCMDALRPMGRYTQIAICGAEIPYSMDTTFYKQLRTQGSITYTAATWDRMMRIYETGKLSFKDVISHRLPITEWEQAFSLCMDKKALKVLMHPVG